MNIKDFFSQYLIQVITWMPLFVLLLFFVLFLLLYFFNDKKFFLNSILIKLSYTKLLIFFVLFRLFYDIVVSLAQYYAWHISGLSIYLLPPYQSINYFLLYVWTHLLLNDLWSFGSTILVFIIFKLIKKAREDSLADEEVLIATLMTLFVGWPRFVVFLPALFIFSLIITVFNTIFRKQAKTSMSLSLVLAAVFSLIFGRYLLVRFGLDVLWI